MQHRGVALDDPRNAGPIAFFAPKPVTRESATHIGPAGPAWRFISPPAPETTWCRAAYDFAGEPAP
jgi:hypothetical protein